MLCGATRCCQSEPIFCACLPPTNALPSSLSTRGALWLSLLQFEVQQQNYREFLFPPQFHWFVLTVDLTNLGIRFFSFLINSRTFTFLLKVSTLQRLLFGISELPASLRLSLGSLWSKIRATWTQELRYVAAGLVTQPLRDWRAGGPGSVEMLAEGGARPGGLRGATRDWSCCSEQRAV